MAGLGTTALTLVDLAKRMDPDGSAADIVEMLAQTNSILQDMRFVPGNMTEGHRTTIRTGLPTVYWRMLNKGVPTSKSTTAQVEERCAMMEARSEVDVELVKLYETAEEKAAYRLGEASAFVEAMSQKLASTLIYGTNENPEEFVGLTPRYSSLSATNKANILSAGGSGSDNTSMWLVGWGPQSVFGIVPKGSKAGIEHKDLGEGTVQDADGNKFQAFSDLWQVKTGFVVRDWRYAVRIPNIDVSDWEGLTNTQATTAATFLPRLMIRALHKLPALSGSVTPVFYCNRTVASGLGIAAMEKSNNVLSIKEGADQMGAIGGEMRFMGVPIRLVDQILNTEAVVS